MSRCKSLQNKNAWYPSIACLPKTGSPQADLISLYCPLLTQCKIEVFVLISFPCFPEFPLNGFPSHTMSFVILGTYARIVIRRHTNNDEQTSAFHIYVCICTYTHILISRPPAHTLFLFLYPHSLSLTSCRLSFVIFLSSQTSKQLDEYS